MQYEFKRCSIFFGRVKLLQDQVAVEDADEFLDSMFNSQPQVV